MKLKLLNPHKVNGTQNTSITQVGEGFFGLILIRDQSLRFQLNRQGSRLLKISDQSVELGLFLFAFDCFNSKSEGIPNG